MTLGAKMINLVWLEPVDQFDEIYGVRQVAVVKEKLHSMHMRVLIQVVDAIRVERARAADDAMDLVTFSEQEIGEIGSILPCDAGDQCFVHEMRTES